MELCLNMWLTLLTEPNTPEVIPNQEQSSIRLTIMKPAGLVDRYNIECVPQGLYPCEPANRTVDVVYPSVDVLYNNLRPYSNYRFTVKAVKGNEHSTPLYVSARTQEAREYLDPYTCYWQLGWKVLFIALENSRKYPCLSSVFYVFVQINIHTLPS